MLNLCPTFLPTFWKRWMISVSLPLSANGYKLPCCDRVLLISAEGWRVPLRVQLNRVSPLLISIEPCHSWVICNHSPTKVMPAKSSNVFKRLEGMLDGSLTSYCLKLRKMYSKIQIESLNTRPTIHLFIFLLLLCPYINFMVKKIFSMAT